MGRLRISSSKAAKTPYYAEAAGIRIFTGEELGYFIGHNLYLIDNSFFSPSLKRFLAEELGAKTLADNLEELIDQYGIYATAGEIAYAVGDLDRKEKELLKKKIEYFDRMTPSERKKLQADNLLKTGDLEAAIDIYRKLLEQPEQLTKEEAGRIYVSLAYAAMEDFDWENAGSLLEKAYASLKQESLLKQRYAISVMNRDQSIPPFVLKNASEAKVWAWHEEMKRIRDTEEAQVQAIAAKEKERMDFRQGLVTADWNREFRKNHKTCCQIIDFSV